MRIFHSQSSPTPRSSPTVDTTLQGPPPSANGCPLLLPSSRSMHRGAIPPSTSPKSSLHSLALQSRNPIQIHLHSLHPRHLLLHSTLVALPRAPHISTSKHT